MSPLCFFVSTFRAVFLIEEKYNKPGTTKVGAVSKAQKARSF